MLLGGIFQQIYNITDALVLGNFVGSRALAAVGTTGSATFFLLAVVNGFGTDVVAVYTTGNRVHQIAALVFLNLSQAFGVYSGQNLGAGKLDRIEEGLKKVALLLLGLSVVAAQRKMEKSCG